MNRRVAGRPERLRQGEDYVDALGDGGKGSSMIPLTTLVQDRPNLDQISARDPGRTRPCYAGGRQVGTVHSGEAGFYVSGRSWRRGGLVFGGRSEATARGGRQ